MPPYTNLVEGVLGGFFFDRQPATTCGIARTPSTRVRSTACGGWLVKNMKEMPLTQGRVAIVSDKDYKYLSQWKWTWLDARGKPGYARRAERINGIHKSILMHRVIKGVTDPKIQVDHKNGNGLDNRRGNLRLATNAQNHHNIGFTKQNSSGYKGVTLISRPSRNIKWMASIKCNNKHIIIGYFGNALEAARAYDKAAKKYHGKYAKTNEDLNVY